MLYFKEALIYLWEQCQELTNMNKNQTQNELSCKYRSHLNSQLCKVGFVQVKRHKRGAEQPEAAG